MNYSPEKSSKSRIEGNAVYRSLVAAIPGGPDSHVAQDCIVCWHRHLRYFFEPTSEILLGLADGYNDDPAFNEKFIQIHPDLAAFIREAVSIYVKKI